MGDLSTTEARLGAVREAVAAEAEPLVTLTHLLRLCRDEHPVLWERMNDQDQALPRPRPRRVRR
jgi:hypothetical protein